MALARARFVQFERLNAAQPGSFLWNWEGWLAPSIASSVSVSSMSTCAGGNPNPGVGIALYACVLSEAKNTNL